MKVESGDTIVLAVDSTVRKWKVSKIDGNTVKIFEEDGSYKQMPYTYLIEMFERGYIKIEPAPVLW